MFKHFIKMTFRSFRRFNKNFLISTLGLSVAFTCVLLVALWVKDEHSVDKFHENESELYQVMLNYKNGNDTYTFEWTPPPLANALVNENPNVELATNVYAFGNDGIIVNNENSSVRTNEIYAGKHFFNMFSFDLLYGDKQDVLNTFDAVAISEVLAKTIFGSLEKAIGKTIKFEQKELSGLYTVSGIFKSIPENSTLQFDAVFSFENLIDKLPEMNSWEDNEPFTYVSLNPNVNLESFNSEVTDLVSEKSTAKNLPSVFVRPFSDKYLYNNYENGKQSGGRIAYIDLFSIIGLIILIIAAVNFINLSTAQAANRFKEIGVKKVLGLEKKSLVIQFLGEAIIMSFLALFISIGVVLLILPQFNTLVNKSISLDVDGSTLFFIVFVPLITGLLSGLYPAFYLSGFKTIKLLRGKFTAKGSEKAIRKALVVFQFTVSVSLIVAVIVITSQIELIQNKPLGYNKEHVIVFKKDGNLKTNLEPFLAEVNTIPGVLKTTTATLEHLTENSTSTRNIIWEGKDTSNNIAFKYILANHGFIELLDINLKDGRTFTKSFETERNKIILNETAVAKIGLKEPVGQFLKIWDQDVQVIGVVKDFNYQSLYENVQPLFMKLSEKGDEVMIKIAAGSERKTLSQIKEVYKSFNYGLNLDFRFLDSEYQSSYESENRFAVLSKYFGGLAILLSCLGLFGLVTFHVGQRYKEIGVRKVLGSSVTGIVVLLSKEFLILVLVSIIVAVPVSWLVMDDWLQDFAYRIELNMWVFIWAAFITILIAITTISFQTIKAAIANPVDSLKTE